MRKNIFILSFIAPILAMNAQDFSTIQNTLDIYGTPTRIGGAKFNSMAGSNGALGGDATSMMTNPAGLGVAITDQLNATISLDGKKNISTLAGNSIELKNNKVNFSNINGVVSVPTDYYSKIKFINFGINYSLKRINNDIVSNAPNQISFLQGTSSGNDTAIFDGHNYSRSGDQSELNLGVGINHDNNLYLGASLNIHSADLEQWDEARFYLQNNNREIYYNQQYTPYRENSTGVSANFGAIGKISKEIRLGIALETPTIWNIERTYLYSGINNRNQIDSEDRTEDRKMITPLKTILSAAYVPNKNFALNVDYTIGITKFKYSELGDVERELNQFFSRSGASTSQVRIGAEYRVKSWRFRGGYAYTSAGLKPFSFDQYMTNGNISSVHTKNVLQGNRQQIGLGIGYDIASFSIDLGYQNNIHKYNNVFLASEYWESTLNGQTPFTTHEIKPKAAGVSEVKQNFNNLYLTIGFKF